MKNRKFTVKQIRDLIALVAGVAVSDGYHTARNAGEKWLEQNEVDPKNNEIQQVNFCK